MDYTPVAAAPASPIVASAPARPEVPHHPPFLDVVIENVESRTLTVVTSDGRHMAVTVPDGLKLMLSKRVGLDQVRAGQFIHGTTREGPDGGLVAIEVHVMPEELRGAVAGHNPTPDPGISMTNGTIAKVGSISGGARMTVTYGGGQSEVRIPNDANLTVLSFVQQDALKPGTKLKLLAQENPPGTWTALYITVIA